MFSLQNFDSLSRKSWSKCSLSFGTLSYLIYMYIFVARKMVYVYYVELFLREVANHVEAKQCDLEGLAYKMLELVYEDIQCWLMGQFLVEEVMVFDDLEALGDLRVDILLRVEHNEALHPDNDEYFFKDEVGGLDIWYGFALLYDDM